MNRMNCGNFSNNMANTANNMANTAQNMANANNTAQGNVPTCPGAVPQNIQPIVLPTQVQTRQCFEFVEQPVISPIQCHTVNNLVAVPRFYTTVTHTSCNNF